jgi:REP element-mobilizing transposase RayT
MPHSFSSSLFHVVFSTKERRKLITEELQPRLWPYLGGIARENDMKTLAVGGIYNHIHILLSMPATITLAKAVQLIKGGSSKWVHDTFPGLQIFEWQEGYGAFSVSISGVPDTIKYIENQAEHHQTTSFEDEFIAFLERHNIPFDPRYVFG